MSQKSVLVIEHEWRMRKMLRANLQALGLVVWEAVSGRHALGLLTEQWPDLIVIDCQLPDIDVAQLLGEIRALGADTVPKTILVSDEPSDARGIRLASDEGFLLRPFSAMVLLREVRRVLPDVPFTG